jgi:hypothetical protein
MQNLRRVAGDSGSQQIAFSPHSKLRCEFRAAEHSKDRQRQSDSVSQHNEIVVLSGDVNKNFDGLLSESEPVEYHSNSVLGYPLSVNGSDGLQRVVHRAGKGPDFGGQKYAKCALTGGGGTVCC